MIVTESIDANAAANLAEPPVEPMEGATTDS